MLVLDQFRANCSTAFQVRRAWWCLVNRRRNKSKIWAVKLYPERQLAMNGIQKTMCLCRKTLRDFEEDRRRLIEWLVPGALDWGRILEFQNKPHDQHYKSTFSVRLRLRDSLLLKPKTQTVSFSYSVRWRRPSLTIFDDDDDCRPRLQHRLLIGFHRLSMHDKLVLLKPRMDGIHFDSQTYRLRI